MGIDYLYLEAVRGASHADVRRVIVEEMAGEGFRVTDDEDGDVAIEIIERGDWIAIHDVREKTPVEWAERLAHALGVVGISGRSWTDFGVLDLARFDGKRRSGKLSVKEPPEGTRLAAPFLVDLASKKSRAKLEKGVEVTEILLDDPFEQLLALAGLPTPYDRYMFDTGGTMLRFRPGAAEEKPDVRVRNVGFETSFHVRDVAEAKVVEAIKRALADEGYASAKTAATRQVFVRDWHGWTSFGEVVEGESGVAWGKLLSRALAAPVLEVVDGEDAAELRAFVGGKVAGKVAVSRTQEQVVVEKAFLAAFGGKKQVKVRVPFNPFLGTGEYRTAVEAIGEAIDLDTPILTGALKGRVLSFARKS